MSPSSSHRPYLRINLKVSEPARPRAGFRARTKHPNREDDRRQYQFHDLSHRFQV